jgi:hypothetical protein
VWYARGRGAQRRSIDQVRTMSIIEERAWRITVQKKNG